MAELLRFIGGVILADTIALLAIVMVTKKGAEKISGGINEENGCDFIELENFGILGRLAFLLKGRMYMEFEKLDAGGEEDERIL